mmetsp:Transcript_60216/g.156286  ORF Transcript_60216/g.156286 Transcript_60216/m.156286 type:complete len:267 (+) Transcript_60216:284-1084(+)
MREHHRAGRHLDQRRDRVGLRGQGAVEDLAREGRALPRAQDDGLHGLRRAVLLVQGAGPVLLHLLRVLHRRALHRRRHGADHAGQGRHGLCRRGRDRVLGIHGHVRLHGCAQHQTQRRPCEGFTSVRPGPRRLRHRRRRRHARAGGLRARQGSRRQDLCGGGGLRRERGRVRRRRAVGRGRGELHEDGSAHGECDQAAAGGLHQHPRHLHAAWRPAGAQGGEARIRGRGLRPVGGVHEVPVGPCPRRRRRARGHLLAADDRQGLPC